MKNESTQQDCGIQKVPIKKPSKAGLCLARGSWKQMGRAEQGAPFPAALRGDPDLESAGPLGWRRTEVENRGTN